MLDIDVEYSNTAYPITLPMYVAVDKALRDASVAAEKKLSAFQVKKRKKGIWSWIEP
jgi:hypothetical protein